MTDRYEGRLADLDVECPACGALPGVRCNSILGLLFPGLAVHKARRKP